MTNLRTLDVNSGLMQGLDVPILYPPKNNRKRLVFCVFRGYEMGTLMS